MSALTTIDVRGGDPLVVEVILPPAEARVVEVIVGLAGPQGPPGLPGGPGFYLPPTVVTGDAALGSGASGLVLVQHTAPCTITLPASPVLGQVLTVKDALGHSATWPITVTGGAAPIEGAGDLTIEFNWSWVSLAYMGAGWGQV